MKRCVVIEQKELVGDVLCAFLAELGLEAVRAENVTSALQLIQTEPTALVVLDWDLPEHGALDVLAGLALIVRDKRPRVLMVTSQCDPKQLALAKEAGVTDHLTKPLDHDAVREIASEISGYSAKRVA